MNTNIKSIIGLSLFLFTLILVIPVYAETQRLGETKISDILTNPEKFVNNEIQVSGMVIEVLSTQTDTPIITYTAYIRLDDGTGSVWAATQAAEPISISEGSTLSVNGFLMTQFTSSSINRTFDLVIFSHPENAVKLVATPMQTSNQIQSDKQIIELQERLNQTEEKQIQQEKRLSWLEEKMNLILQWLRSIIRI